MTLVYPEVINAGNIERLIDHVLAKVAEVIRANATISNGADSSEPLVMDHCRLATTSILNKEHVRKIKKHTTELVNAYIIGGVTVGYDRVSVDRLAVDQRRAVKSLNSSGVYGNDDEAAVSEKKATLTRKIYPDMQNFFGKNTGYRGDFKMRLSLSEPAEYARTEPESYTDMIETTNKPTVVAASHASVRPSAPSLEEYVEPSRDTTPKFIPPGNNEYFWDHRA